MGIKETMMHQGTEKKVFKVADAREQTEGKKDVRKKSREEKNNKEKLGGF